MHHPFLLADVGHFHSPLNSKGFPTLADKGLDVISFLLVKQQPLVLNEIQHKVYQYLEAKREFKSALALQILASLKELCTDQLTFMSILSSIIIWDNLDLLVEFVSFTNYLQQLTMSGIPKDGWYVAKPHKSSWSSPSVYIFGLKGYDIPDNLSAFYLDLLSYAIERNALAIMNYLLSRGGWYGTLDGECKKYLLQKSIFLQEPRSLINHIAAEYSTIHMAGLCRGVVLFLCDKMLQTGKCIPPNQVQYLLNVAIQERSFSMNLNTLFTWEMTRSIVCSSLFNDNIVDYLIEKGNLWFDVDPVLMNDVLRDVFVDFMGKGVCFAVMQYPSHLKQIMEFLAPNFLDDENHPFFVFINSLYYYAKKIAGKSNDTDYIINKPCEADELVQIFLQFEPLRKHIDKGLSGKDKVSLMNCYRIGGVPMRYFSSLEPLLISQFNWITWNMDFKETRRMYHPLSMLLLVYWSRNKRYQIDELFFHIASFLWGDEVVKRISEDIFVVTKQTKKGFVILNEENKSKKRKCIEASSIKVE